MDTNTEEVSEQELEAALEDAGISREVYEKMESDLHGVREFLSKSGMNFILAVSDKDNNLSVVGENVSGRGDVARDLIRAIAGTLEETIESR